MKKHIAFLLCLIMITSMFSCDLTQKNKGAESSTAPIEEQPEKDVTEGEDTTGSTESTQITEAARAMQMYEAAIRGEICVVDERLGEIKLEDCCFPSNDLPLGRCDILNKAILDMDGDGVNEYVIQSPDKDHIVLHYYDGKVYSYCFDSNSFHNLNTDGSFYWRDPHGSENWSRGSSRIVFDGASLSVKEIYRIKLISPPDDINEYYIDGEKISREEYLECYDRKSRESFSPLDISCQYPISAEEAWEIAATYWDLIDCGEDAALGRTRLSKIVLLDKPSNISTYYHIIWQVEYYYHHTDGWESQQPKAETYREVYINAMTGAVREYTDTVLPDGKGYSESEWAMYMYEAAIIGEICVVDERLGEVKLKDCRFPSNNWPLSACEILYNAILDMDGDGINEYVIKSPEHECIILRYYNDKVYSYWLDTVDFYNFNTNGSFHWYDALEEDAWECGLIKLVFEGSTLNVRPVYSMKYSSNPTKYEYFVGGEAVTIDEYDTYRADIWYERVKFSQFELMPRYPITAQQAWNLANAYWDNQDGGQEAGAGTIWTARIVLIDTPNSETDYYRFAFQVECNVGGGQEGYECMPPRDFKVADQILVNAITGEVVASTYDPDGKVVSVEEAIEIAKDHATDVNGEICNEENGYRVEPAVTNSAPDHFHVIVVRQHDTIIDRLWIDKYTGELVHSYYLYGKG